VQIREKRVRKVSLRLKVKVKRDRGAPYWIDIILMFRTPVKKGIE